MDKAEGWNMYLEIQDLKKKHFNVSQISRRLDLSRTTVYKYLDPWLSICVNTKLLMNYLPVMARCFNREVH